MPHGAPLIYLCGHSLGLQPLAARDIVNEELDDWARLGVLGHEQARRPWMPYHENLTAGLAALGGRAPGRSGGHELAHGEPAPDAGELLPPARHSAAAS